MDFLTNLLENSTMPWLTALLLGLMTAISPCPLATNITAIGFISKDIEDRNRVFLKWSVLHTWQSNYIYRSCFDYFSWC